MISIDINIELIEKSRKLFNEGDKEFIWLTKCNEKKRTEIKRK
jgi:hypothetical protein